MAGINNLAFIILMFIHCGIVTTRRIGRDTREGPTCTPPAVVNKGNRRMPDYRIVVKCTLPDGVKKEPTCLFISKGPVRGRDGEFKEEKVEDNFKTFHERLPNGTYTGTCELLMRVSKLTLGSYTFVSYFPDNNRDYKPHKFSKAIDIRKPRIELTDCPKGNDVNFQFIKINSNASCKCDLVDRGNPPGYVQWQDSTTNQFIGIPSKESAILDLFYDETNKRSMSADMDGSSGDDSDDDFDGSGDDSNAIKRSISADMGKIATYTCRGKSMDNFETTLTYKPKYAYGPTDVIPLESMRHRQIKLCSGSQNITLICEVRRENYFPDVGVVVEGFGDSTITETEQQETEYGKRFTFSLDLTEGGSFKPTCKGYNTVFVNILTEESTILEVQEPPSALPILKINDGSPIADGQTVDVTFGQLVTIKCLVYGGYPTVSQTTIKILNGKGQSNTTIGSQDSLTLNVTKDMHNIVTECSALHVSKCYDKKSRFKFNVQYGAEITEFTISNTTTLLNETKVEVAVDSYLTFDCVAMGNPIPYEMYIQNRHGQGSFRSHFSHDKNSSMVTFTKKMSCEDTGRYTCSAYNEVDNPTSQDVLILVKCPLRLRYDDDSSFFETKEGARVHIVFNILGYPKATQHVLHKIVARSGENVEETEIDVEPDSIIFPKVDDLYSVVVLIMHKMDSKQTGHYRLEVGNGIGQNLNFTFEIAMVIQGSGLSSTIVVCIVIIAFLVILIIVILGCIYCKRNKQDHPRKPEKGMGGYAVKPKANELYGTADTSIQLPMKCSVSTYAEVDKAKKHHIESEPYAEVNKGKVYNIECHGTQATA